MRTPSLGTAFYTPGILPNDPNALVRSLAEELQNISAAIQALSLGHLDKTTVAPPKPRDGDLRYADGTSWNPYNGPGTYVYINGEWKQSASADLWDDLNFPFTQTKLGALSKPDFDYTNVGLLFPQNDATEVVYIIGQLPHGYLAGSDIKPHIHWQQTGATVPTWKIAYKWFNNGAAVPAAFTTISATGEVFTYVSGSLAQISTWPAISGTGMKESSILLIKLYREDNTVTGDVLAFEFDIHIQKNKRGTYTERGYI